MATPSPAAETALQIKRTFQAPREKVFRAWTEPEEMKHWCGPTDEYETHAEVDLCVGGKYRIEMKHSGGGVHTAIGEYREVEVPSKLVYTWSWEDGTVEDTVVTVEFSDLGSATEVTLTHDLFPSGDWRDKHSEGWTGCLGRLENRLAG